MKSCAIGNEPMLAIEQVEKSFVAPDGITAAPILRGINMRVRAGESLAIVGPSGSGKSTLLNIIGGLDRPSSGVVRLAGRDLAQLSDQELARVRNLEIGFVFQQHHLLPQCTVLENVLVPTLPCASAAATREAPERARQLLERVGLSARLDYRPGQLSGGERQRAAVVRALINQPRLLLADEPTGSLDRAAAENLAQLLAALNQEQQVTLIVVTHSMDLARRMARQFVLKDGQLAAV